MPLTIHRFGLLSGLCVLIIGLVAYGKFVSHSTTQRSIPAAIVPNQSAQVARDALEVELITIRPEGFEPLAITRPRGPFVLFIEDRSGKEDSSFQLQRAKGERLKDLNTNRRKSKWYDTLDLPPGDYVLTDVANAERRCQITILP